MITKRERKIYRWANISKSDALLSEILIGIKKRMFEQTDRRKKRLLQSGKGSSKVFHTTWKKRGTFVFI